MSGEPVWLASASLWSDTGPVGTTDWKPRQLESGQRVLDTLLDGLGDPEVERSFRMCLTLCRHRRVRPDELAGLPQSFHRARARFLAGGPVEILWSRGCTTPVSCRPCENPRWVPLDFGLSIPKDCGKCLPCARRIELEKA